MKAYLTRLKEWFAALAPREQRIVAAGSIVGGIIVLYSAVWDPLVKAHLGRELALSQSRSLAQRLETVGAAVQRAPRNAVNRGGSLISVVDQASRSNALGKQPRLQPEGDSEVRLSVDAISFDALVRWLADLETRYGVQVQSAEIEKQDAPGVVDARISLVRP